MSNIVWSNGKIDPWSAGGVTLNATAWTEGKKNDDIKTVALFIDNSAHHTDLRTPKEADPETLKVARNIERMHIRKWIAEYYDAMPTFKADKEQIMAKQKEQIMKEENASVKS